MLRKGLCVALFLWSAMPALAEPLPSGALPSATETPERGFSHPIDLSAPFHGALQPQMRDGRAVATPHEWGEDSSTETQGLPVGPLRIGSGDEVGRHRQFARFRVEGVTLFGGSVGGSVDGRSANIVLSWPATP
jgi:hypothetical protein